MKQIRKLRRSVAKLQPLSYRACHVTVSPSGVLCVLVVINHPFWRAESGPELIKDAGLVERLHSYVLQISTDEKSDVIIHKIGQTILRCIPLRNLPGLTDTRSAYVYRSFGRSPGALEG